jgi:hypothetical protein
MIKYYVIGNIDSDAVQAVKYHQGVDEVLEIIDEKYIWKIPHDQDFTGIAVVIKENAILSESFEPNDFIEKTKPMFFSPCKSVYIINCEQSKFTVVNLNRLDDYMRFQLVAPHRWGESVDLAKLFNLPVDQPVFEDEKWVTPEPEPSDFEVETWVPQDEFPDNGE